MASQDPGAGFDIFAIATLLAAERVRRGSVARTLKRREGGLDEVLTTPLQPWLGSGLGLGLGLAGWMSCSPRLSNPNPNPNPNPRPNPNQVLTTPLETRIKPEWSTDKAGAAPLQS